MPDGVRGRLTRFRAPGGAPDPAEEADELGYRDRAMPVGSILWAPLDSAAGQGPPPALSVPIFFQQQALTAVHQHGSTPGTCFGLLLGDLYRSPDSGTPYLMVESTFPLPGDAGLDAMTALSGGWDAGQEVSRHRGLQPIGWYRAGDAAALEPSPAELEAHATWFRQPWQIVVTAASGAVPVGAVYRPSAWATSARQPLPFFEVVDRSGNDPHREQETRLTWTNYLSDQAIPASPPAPAPVAAGPDPSTQASPPPQAPPRASASSRAPRVTPTAPPTPVLFMPDVIESSDVAGPVRIGALRRLAQRRAVRVATYATGGVVAVIGLLRAFLAAPAAPAVREPPPPPPAVSPQERFDRAGDTLALAVAAFDLRARLFASRQMECTELARGLVLVEQRWGTYNLARKDVGLLDSARTARDRALYADADAVERRFEVSACPRP